MEGCTHCFQCFLYKDCHLALAIFIFKSEGFQFNVFISDQNKVITLDILKLLCFSIFFSYKNDASLNASKAYNGLSWIFQESLKPCNAHNLIFPSEFLIFLAEGQLKGKLSMPSLERRKKGIKGEGFNLLQRMDEVSFLFVFNVYLNK